MSRKFIIKSSFAPRQKSLREFILTSFKALYLPLEFLSQNQQATKIDCLS